MDISNFSELSTKQQANVCGVFYGYLQDIEAKENKFATHIDMGAVINAFIGINPCCYEHPKAGWVFVITHKTYPEIRAACYEAVNPKHKNNGCTLSQSEIVRLYCVAKNEGVELDLSQFYKKSDFISYNPGPIATAAIQTQYYWTLYTIMDGKEMFMVEDDGNYAYSAKFDGNKIAKFDDEWIAKQVALQMQQRNGKLHYARLR